MAATPYQLRADLIIQARCILERKHETDLEAFRAGRYIHCPEAPTTDEIIREAKKLNEFVSTY